MSKPPYCEDGSPTNSSVKEMKMASSYRTCSESDCESERKVRGWCARHYQRWLIHGDATTVNFAQRHNTLPLVERFWIKVQKFDSCWIWQAGGSNGYGKYRGDGRTVFAHRFAYEDKVGPIPDGLTIDHLCRNKLCVRPDHLEPVTSHENIRRAVKASKTHCKRGHPLKGDNLLKYALPKKRVCRTCRHQRQKAYREMRYAG